MTQLSEHFTLEELVRSASAEQRGLDNTPSSAVVDALRRSAASLEQVRHALGDQALRVTSRYRSVQVNKAVGGAVNSAHCLGYAIDFLHPSLTPYEVCRQLLASGIAYDQLIHEFGSWTHISFDPQMRRQALTIVSSARGYLNGIQPIGASGG